MEFGKESLIKFEDFVIFVWKFSIFPFIIITIFASFIIKIDFFSCFLSFKRISIPYDCSKNDQE